MDGVLRDGGIEPPFAFSGGYLCIASNGAGHVRVPW
jgi:hypothetical protein